MTRRRTRKMMRIGCGLVPLGSAAYKADYDARVKAAGLDGDWDGIDIDEQRGRLARLIHMYMDEWSGCPEAICQRMRGCMAPDERCANVPELSEEERAARWPQTLVTVRRALDELKRERELDSHASAPFVPAKAGTQR